MKRRGSIPASPGLELQVDRGLETDGLSVGRNSGLPFIRFKQWPIALTVCAPWQLLDVPHLADGTMRPDLADNSNTTCFGRCGGDPVEENERSVSGRSPNPRCLGAWA